MSESKNVGLQTAGHASIVDPFVTALNEHLLVRYGGSMGYADVAQELRTTAAAVRLRQFRLGDMPPRIPHLKAARWPTPDIAEWLCSLSTPRLAQADTQRVAIVVTTAERGHCNHGRPRMRRTEPASKSLPVMKAVQP